MRNVRFAYRSFHFEKNERNTSHDITPNKKGKKRNENPSVKPSENSSVIINSYISVMSSGCIICITFKKKKLESVAWVFNDSLGHTYDKLHSDADR